MALMSCNEKNVEIQDLPSSAETVELTVNLPDMQTRIAGVASGDDNVDNLQVFVFNDMGVLEAYESENSKTISLTCVPGDKEVVALVNAPSLAGIGILSDLRASVSKLSDNADGRLVMVSNVVPKLLIAGKDNSMTIEVSRLAAKVVLGTVRNEMALESNRNKVFKLKSVFLTNVAGDRKYLSESAVTSWYDKMKYESTNTLPFLYDALDEQVGYEASYTTPHYFYCYPNVVAEDTYSGAWSPRKTRLVVEAMLGDQTCYYPITLPIVERNNEYIINLTVTRFGSLDPDNPVTTDDASFTVTVKEWTNGGERDEII